MGKIINVSNRLPVKVVEINHDHVLKPTNGGLKTILESLKEHIEFSWVGWPGPISCKSIETKIESDLKTKFNYIPVFLNEELIDLYYFQYSNETLWPILHGFLSECNYSEKAYRGYVKANELFAEKLLEIIDENDSVWIHDYHLMLVPKLLREKSSKAINIVFYFHTAWPCSQMFQMIPQSKELCDSLLHSDLIGFHVLHQKLNFLKTCNELFGIHASDSVSHKRLQVKVWNCVFGINPKSISNCLNTDKTINHIKTIKEKYRGKKLIIGVDRADYIKGIDLKFKAFDLFLKSGNMKNVILHQIAVPTRENILTYQKYQSQLEQTSNLINEQHGRVIEYEYDSVDLHYLVALLHMADICIICSLSDGLNLVAFEYVTSQVGRNGVLLLSQFAGCASVFDTPMKFNPIDTDQLAGLIQQTFQLSESERKKIQEKLFETVINNTSKHWLDKLINELDI